NGRSNAGAFTVPAVVGIGGSGVNITTNQMTMNVIRLGLDYKFDWHTTLARHRKNRRRRFFSRKLLGELRAELNLTMTICSAGFCTSDEYHAAKEPAALMRKLGCDLQAGWSRPHVGDRAGASPTPISSAARNLRGR